MNYFSAVADSITPSTQSTDTHKQGHAASTSFSDTLEECIGTEKEANNSAQTEAVKQKAENLISEMETMETVMADLQNLLSGFFDSNGIPKDPPVMLGYDESGDRITVHGDREDTEHISELINSDSELKADVKDTLDKAEALVQLMRNIRESQENNKSEKPSVNLVFGTRAALRSNEKLPTEQIDGQQAAIDDELANMFDTIQKMLLQLFVQDDPEDAEESESERADNGAVENAADTSEEEGLNEYRRLLLQIEQTRAEAVFMGGTDKNRYAYAVRSYSAVMESGTEKSTAETAETEPADNAVNMQTFL